MAHQVETMFSVRQVPWHGLGKVIEDEVDSVAAIKAAGLDWEVKQTPIYQPNGNLIPEYYANIRSSDNKVLGVVTGRYTIVQNQQAFAFTDALVGSGDVKYETAGSLHDGKKVWMLAKLQGHEGFHLNDDKTEIYICFTNTHDGSGAVRVLVTPIRVVCQNTLNLAIKGAHRAWSTTHVGDIGQRLKEAERTLKQTGVYMASLQEQAAKAAGIKISARKYAEIMEELVPMSGKETAKEKATIEAKRDGIAQCLKADDIARFRGTGYALINAVSDFAGHSAPIRMTPTFADNRFDSIVSNNKLLDTVTKLVFAA
jgi:phage/plasmid-like protein (TIGR03299 family)